MAAFSLPPRQVRTTEDQPSEACSSSQPHLAVWHQECCHHKVPIKREDLVGDGFQEPAPRPGPSPPSASTPGRPGTSGSGCRCRIGQNSLVQQLFATSSLLYVHFHDCTIHLKSSHSGRSSSRGTFLLHLGCCQSGKGGKITNTKSKSRNSQLFQNGEVSQDYSGLVRLNSFQPRQTFWWQNVSVFQPFSLKHVKLFNAPGRRLCRGVEARDL